MRPKPWPFGVFPCQGKSGINTGKHKTIDITRRQSAQNQAAGLLHMGGNNNMKEIKRGDLYYADLRPIIGSEQGGVRPVLIIQNDVGNHFSPTVIAASITSRQRKHRLPTHVFLPVSTEGLQRNSIVLLEQVRTIDRTRLGDYIGKLDETAMEAVDAALAISIGIKEKAEMDARR